VITFHEFFSELNGKEPPILCDYNSRTKIHRFCCSPKENSNDQERRPELVSLQVTNGGRRYNCEDYVPQCQKWAREVPNSCTDGNHPSFLFMSIACMQSCEHCGRKVGHLLHTLQNCQMFLKAHFQFELNFAGPFNGRKKNVIDIKLKYVYYIVKLK